MFRYRLLTTGLIIIVFLVIGYLGASLSGIKTPFVKAYHRQNLVRLHVIARSNSPADQALKLKVRDRILETMEPLLIDVEKRELACQILSKNLKRIKQVIREELPPEQRQLPVKIKLGKYAFPAKEYPFGVLPAGEYTGLRVILGAGKGQNWWCVLYPPLCLLDPDAPGFRKDVGQKEKQKIVYRLAFLEKLLEKKGKKKGAFWVCWSNVFSRI